MTDKIEEFLLRHRTLVFIVMAVIFIAMLPLQISLLLAFISITITAPTEFIAAAVLGAITGIYFYYRIHGLEEIGIKGGKQGLGGIFK